MTGRALAACIALALLAGVPYWVGGTYYINISSQILIYAVFAMGLNVLVGYAGLVSLGHAGLFGTARLPMLAASAHSFAYSVLRE